MVIYQFFVRMKKAMVSFYFSKSTSELFFEIARSTIFRAEISCYITTEISLGSPFSDGSLID